MPYPIACDEIDELLQMDIDAVNQIQECVRGYISDSTADSEDIDALKCVLKQQQKLLQVAEGAIQSRMHRIALCYTSLLKQMRMLASTHGLQRPMCYKCETAMASENDETCADIDSIYGHNKVER